MSPRAPTVLVLRALGIGDLLTAVPALRALAHAFPDHRRVLAAPGALGPLARLTDAIDSLLNTDPLSSLNVRNRPDVAVNLHGRGPQSHRILLATRPRELIAFAHEDIPETVSSPPWPESEHEVRRWCALLESTGIPCDGCQLTLDPPALPGSHEAHGATLIHPGAAFESRRWPASRFAAVARAEAAAGRKVLVTGTAAERELAVVVARGGGLPRSAVYAGRTSLVGLASLVRAAGRVVCGDTGVAHLATAVGTPSVVLFGPTTPAEWGPPRGCPAHRVLWKGRTGNPHGIRADPGLLMITVDDVLRELSVLERGEKAA